MTKKDMKKIYDELNVDTLPRWCKGSLYLLREAQDAFDGLMKHKEFTALATEVANFYKARGFKIEMRNGFYLIRV